MAAASEKCQGCDRPVSSDVAFCCSWCASASQEGRPSFHVAACNNAQAARLAAMDTEQPQHHHDEQHDELDVDARAASDALEARARESFQDAVRLDAFAPHDARQAFLEGYVRGAHDQQQAPTAG